MAFIKTYMPNEIISAEGDTDKNIFVLISGTVAVYKNNVKISEFNKEGTILGELSAILNKPRTATIKAITDSELYVYENTLQEIIKMHPDFTLKLLRALAERLAAATEKII